MNLYVVCRGCDWTPDPVRRMAADNQAAEHTRESGHVTVSGMRP